MSARPASRSFASFLALSVAALALSRNASAQPVEPAQPSDPAAPGDPADPKKPPGPPGPPGPPPFPKQDMAAQFSVPQVVEEEPRRSEGRMLVSLYNTGFQWGVSPGVILSHGEAGFFLGLRFGYGFDLDSVILVPALRLDGYFTDPNVYVTMPMLKVVFPIDRFAPFIQAGTGLGYVAYSGAGEAGIALMGGGGLMIHFSRVAFGAEASYQRITGTSFEGISVGPILAIGF